MARIEQLNRNLAQECLDKMGRGFLAGVGTDSAARDMDVVRQALGDDQINFLGFSYGTDLGASYLEKFPNRVRAMVLDGAIDPAEGSDGLDHPADDRFSGRLQRLRRRLREVRRLPAGHRPGAG